MSLNGATLFKLYLSANTVITTIAVLFV